MGQMWVEGEIDSEVLVLGCSLIGWCRTGGPFFIKSTKCHDRTEIGVVFKGRLMARSMVELKRRVVDRETISERVRKNTKDSYGGYWVCKWKGLNMVLTVGRFEPMVFVRRGVG